MCTFVSCPMISEGFVRAKQNNKVIFVKKVQTVFEEHIFQITWKEDR